MVWNGWTTILTGAILKSITPRGVTSPTGSPSLRLVSKNMTLITDEFEEAKSRQLDNEFIHKLRTAARKEFFDTFMHKLLDFDGDLQTLEGLHTFGDEMKRFYAYQDDNHVGFMDEVRKYMCEQCDKKLGKHQVVITIPPPDESLQCSVDCQLRENCEWQEEHLPRIVYPGPGCPHGKGG